VKEYKEYWNDLDWLLEYVHIRYFKICHTQFETLHVTPRRHEYTHQVWKRDHGSPADWFQESKH